MASRRAVLRRIVLAGLALSLPRSGSAEPLRTVVAAARPGRFLAWPANGGLWSWDQGREILVGFIEGPWLDRPDTHKIGQPQSQRLLRSRNGGESWRIETPAPWPGREGPVEPLPEPLRFDHPDLAVKVAGEGGKGGKDATGRFFVSEDRGRRWRGPYPFAGLAADPRLQGFVFTSRTSVTVLGPRSALFLLSARDPGLGRLSGRLDRTLAVLTDDGGLSFRFLSWVVSPSDPFRAVMPSAVSLAPGHLVAALRRRDPSGGEEANWIDAYATADGGASWSFLSRVADTGCCNGNPPALTRLEDGRLACAYANRSLRRMLLRLSDDGGRHWGTPITIGSDSLGWDLGYPQLLVNHRGELVVIYYLATKERPQAYIEATLLRPPAG